MILGSLESPGPLDHLVLFADLLIISRGAGGDMWGRWGHVGTFTSSTSRTSTGPIMKLTLCQRVGAISCQNRRAQHAFLCLECSQPVLGLPCARSRWKPTYTVPAHGQKLLLEDEEIPLCPCSGTTAHMARSMGKELKTSREELAQVRTSLEKEKMTVLATRCEYLNRTVKSRDLALTEAAKNLNDQRMALKHQDHQVKLLEVQLHSCENERQVRVRQLEEMMEAVQKLSSEKELTYQIMLTLKVFVEAHPCVLSCMAMLNERLASSKAHIEALKGELSAACMSPAV
eukprot:Em0044g6a